MKRSLRLALASLGRAPLDAGLTVLAIAGGLFLCLALELGRENFATLAAGWMRSAELVVYLEGMTPPARARQIADTVAKLPSVDRIQLVDSKEAYGRLKRSLGDRAELLDGVEEGMLPGSIEVTLKEGAAASPLAERLRRVPGIEEVEQLGDWRDPVRAAERALRLGVLLMGALALLGGLALVAASIRGKILRARERIEVLALVGATRRHVAGPLWAEGALDGAIGGLCGLGGLYWLYRVGAPWAQHALGATLSAAPFTFVRPLVAITALAGAVLTGLLGSALAVSRHVAR